MLMGSSLASTITIMDIMGWPSASNAQTHDTWRCLPWPGPHLTMNGLLTIGFAGARSRARHSSPEVVDIYLFNGGVQEICVFLPFIAYSSPLSSPLVPWLRTRDYNCYQIVLGGSFKVRGAIRIQR